MADTKTKETEKPKKKKSNNYFDEEKVTKWIVEYQTSALKEIDSEGKVTVLWKDVVLEEKIMVEVIKIVKAIIQVYRYYVFEDYDDCLQHGSMSCYQNFMKWTKEKGSAFNFFSIISKRSLLNYTDRRKKHRNHNDIADQIDLYDNKSMNFDFYLEEVQDTLIDIVNKSFMGKKRKRFISISLILVDYLKKTKKFVSKTDFYSWARSYGMRSIDIREFMKAMREHGTELFGDAEDDID
jgi:hypothetical protein